MDEIKPDEITDVVSGITDLMVHDVTDPPLASFFFYASLVGYEVVTQNDSLFKSLHGALRDYPDIKYLL